jgi:hypothetical protein
VIGKQFEPFVIPCKPTSPKVQVELMKEDGEVINIQSFNETIGFVAVSEDQIEGGVLACLFSLGNRNFFSNFSLTIDRRFQTFVLCSNYCKVSYENHIYSSLYNCSQDKIHLMIRKL